MKIRLWWRMTRPMQLLSIVLVYGLGALMARAMRDTFDLTTLIGGLLALLPVAVSVHYVNEYADHETDALTQRTPFSGGSGALLEGGIARRRVLMAAWGALIVGLALALIVDLGMAGGLLLGAIAFGGWMYSLPPLKLAWRGWGELDNALLGGMILPLYSYAVQTGHIDGSALVACIPFTIFVFLNLLATTWADRAADHTVGKYTLATVMSARVLRRLYAVGGIVGLTLLLGCVPREVALISVVAAPFFAWGALRYTRTDAPHAGVYTMVVLLCAHLVGWGVIAL
jgi:1,4-dihydroxy-2-naphthoate octaprenyltransferase